MHWSFFYDAEDEVGGITNSRATVWRWRPHFQNDFEARMDWSVQSYDEANHNSIAAYGGGPGINIIEITASPGSKVFLNAEGSTDPDGDNLFFNWFVYGEAGTYGSPVDLTNATTKNPTLYIPQDAEGQNIHVVLEVADDGDPVLYNYKRAVISVR